MLREGATSNDDDLNVMRNSITKFLGLENTTWFFREIPNPTHPGQKCQLAKASAHQSVNELSENENPRPSILKDSTLNV